MKRLHLAFLAVLAAVGLVTAAHAGGTYEQYPTVTSLTGIETLAADTNLAGGVNPQTGKYTLSSLGGGLVQVVTTNASVTTVAGTRFLISNQGVATIASVAMPPSPTDNQIFTIVNAGSGALTLTAIVVSATPSGTTIVGGAAPTSLAVQTNNAAAAALSSVSYVYRAADNKWYRIQ